MVEQEKAQFKAMMRALTQLFNKPDLDIELLRIWWHKLSRFDFSVVSKSLDAWVDSNKRMPTPADIMELCKSQEQKIIPTSIGRKYTEDEKQANHERLLEIKRKLGWVK